MQIIRGDVKKGELPAVDAYLEAARARMNELKILTQRNAFDGLSIL